MSVPTDIAIAYLIQGSFYGHSIYATIYMDAWRKDSAVMVVHHIITLALICFSYAFRYSPSAFMHVPHGCAQAFKTPSGFQVPQCGDPGVVSPWHQWHPAGVHQAQHLPEVQGRRLLPAQRCAVQHGLRQLQYHMVRFSKIFYLFLGHCEVFCCHVRSSGLLTQSLGRWMHSNCVFFPSPVSGSGSVSTGSLWKCCTPPVYPASSPSLPSLSTSSSTLSFLRCCSWISTGSWWGPRKSPVSFPFVRRSNSRLLCSLAAVRSSSWFS